MNAKQILRMREAKENVEDPIVEAFVKNGIKAERNHDVRTQVAHGDVFFYPQGEIGIVCSVEAQETKEYTNFSYKKRKVVSYVGPSGLDNAYVLLGAKERKDSENRVYIMVNAGELRKFILDPSNRCIDRGEYYTINPGETHNINGIFAAGDTIEEVVTMFVGLLRE